MFSVPRFIGGLAAAGLSVIAAMPTAHALGNVGYTDQLCTAFYADPSSQPPNQVMKCARMSCAITPDGSYVRPGGSTFTLLVTCQNPSATTFKWVLSPKSDAGCPAPQLGLDTANTITLTASGPRVCYYEAITGDGNSNNGWTRYGIVWQ